MLVPNFFVSARRASADGGLARRPRESTHPMEFLQSPKLAILKLTMVLVAAALFALPAQAVTIPMVYVGDAGNAGEWSGDAAGGLGDSRLCGAVDHAYQIGKYEVTAAQYVEFLNLKAKTDPYGLYNPLMSSAIQGCKIEQTGADGSYSYSVAADFANRPVNYVSFFDAARFVNWLGNGQGNGDTETGAYTLNGYFGPDGRDILRNPGATWFIPSEDEWYKAAYYDPNKPGARATGTTPRGKTPPTRPAGT